jgi:N-acetylglutamate synthase-like GNAT family acetyltransferase
MGAIRRCERADFAAVLAIVNDAAQAYRGHIPADRWHDPYMPADDLERELAAGVAFAGYEEAGALVGVMGVQDVRDVTLIRHAYVATAARGRGIGGALLAHLLAGTARPVLIGTWAAATWAVGFYEQHGFRLVSPAEKERLLRAYWSIPDRQIATSVVLVDSRWRRLHPSPDNPQQQEDRS